MADEVIAKRHTCKQKKYSNNQYNVNGVDDDHVMNTKTASVA